jgi:hypothetical protein
VRHLTRIASQPANWLQPKSHADAMCDMSRGLQPSGQPLCRQLGCCC